MEDDEEYSYKRYSENTKQIMTGQEAAFVENEEVYSYKGYNDEIAATTEEVKTNSYGDFIVEEFSAETNVPRVAKLTKLPVTIVTYIFAAVYFAVGVVCVSATSSVTEILPYIVGAMMAVVGVVRFIIAMVHHEYRHLKTNQTATSLILTALGIMIIIQELDVNNDSAIMLISIVWGILGLFEGAHAFNHAFKRIANSERSVFFLLRGLVECAVAFMLLYQPTDHSAHHFHIIVFGINLILDGIMMIPQVKSFLTMK